jgi:large subunit ribosomal protein L25
VDVRELMVGQSIRVKDLATHAKWKAVTDPETMLLHIIIPRVEETPAPGAEVAAAGAAAAPAEPEVIKKGKKEEEGAEAAASAPGKKEKK